MLCTAMPRLETRLWLISAESGQVEQQLDSTRQDVTRSLTVNIAVTAHTLFRQQTKSLFGGHVV